eukprot:PhM_4_TR2118/c1_g1_i3/m.57404
MGVHCGPCFGAVMGTTGLTFDVFGDTVNTASRMMSTAGRDTLQLSSVAAEWLSDAGMLPGTCLVPLSPIKVKGKGTMTVFRLDMDGSSAVVRPLGNGDLNF